MFASIRDRRRREETLPTARRLARGVPGLRRGSVRREIGVEDDVEVSDGRGRG
jgi:hypothetical protein